MRVHRARTILTLLLIGAAAACGTRGPRLDQLDAEALFRRGMEQFEAGRWRDAGEAFEHLVFVHPGFARLEEARYYLGETYFQRREFLTAATEWIRLAADFPAGTFADDARFRACEAYVELSPHPRREQSFTEAAIDHCESLIAFYPQSEHVPAARQIILDMRTKLAEKLFLTGEDYRRWAFDSAILYYNFVLQDFPDTPVVPRALLRLFQIYDRLEYEQEREEVRQRLLRDFPDSAEAREVGGARVASAP